MFDDSFKLQEMLNVFITIKKLIENYSEDGGYHISSGVRITRNN